MSLELLSMGEVVRQRSLALPDGASPRGLAAAATLPDDLTH